MSTTRKQQATCVQSQLMTEIILNVLPLLILDEKMLIAFRHRMYVRYVRYDIDVIANAFAMLNRQQSFFGYLRPSSCYAVQVATIRKESSADGIG